MRTPRVIYLFHLFFKATSVNNPICSDRLNTMALFPRKFEIIHISAFRLYAPVCLILLFFAVRYFSLFAYYTRARVFFFILSELKKI